MSQSNKVVILGANGLLGIHVIKALERYSPHLKLIAQFKERFVSSMDLNSYLSAINPAAIINCMGYLGSDREQNLLVNACMPRVIADWCDNHEVLSVHVSTNAVFSAHETRFWEPNDYLAPTSVYEVAKALGEDPRSYVVRASFIGTCGRNRGIFDKLLTGQGYIDRKWNGVTAWTLAKRIVDITNQHYGTPKKCLEHVHSQNVVTFNDLAVQIKSSSISECYIEDARLLGGGILLPDIEIQLEEYINLRCIG